MKYGINVKVERLSKTLRYVDMFTSKAIANMLYRFWILLSPLHCKHKSTKKAKGILLISVILNYITFICKLYSMRRGIF